MREYRPYLSDILQRIEMIREFTAHGRDEFKTSLMQQESVIRSFEVIGEIIKRLPSNLLDEQPDVPWRQFTGFRDVLIHQYNKIDLDVVWDAVENELEPLKLAVESLLQSLDQASDPEEEEFT